MSEQAAAKITPRDLFQNRDFRLLWLGQSISNFGDSMTNLALLLLVNHLTGSTAALATMAIVLALPTLTFGLIAGVYVDRWDRKRLMIVSDLIRGVLVLGFALVNAPEKIWLLYVIGFVQASIGTLFNPARSALIPNIVAKEGLLAANSLTQMTQIIFGLLGTAAAGALVGLMDIYWPVFVIDALTFFAALLLVSAIAFRGQPAPRGASTSPRAIFGELGGGLRITFGNRILAGTILAAAVTMLGLGAVNVLLVPLIVNDLQIPETWFAGVEFAQTSAMILSGALVAVLAAKFKPTHILTVAFVGVGLCVGVMSGITAAWQLILVLFIVGWFITPLQASAQTIAQTAVPDEVRGRTGAANNALITTANLISMAAAGVLADALGVRTVFIISGIVVASAGLVAGLMFRGVEMPAPKSVVIEPA
ncbi:MAG TPA: MFS transporter [Anaerolineales bacterium]|nr:MFS transporter [Anaerolineales bacterium]